VVRVLHRGRMGRGEYSTTWNGRNNSGDIVARGIYFVRVVAPGIDEYRKVIVAKD
jgi:flagellar hook assembly protein FlgD